MGYVALAYLYSTEVQVAIFSGLVFLLLWKKLQKPKRFPPGPPALPLVGSAPFIGKSALKGQRLQDHLAEKYGDVVGIYGGRDAMVFLSNADTVRTLFKTDQITLRPKNSPFHELRYGDENGPRGLIFSYGEEWKEQRRFALRNLRDLGFGKASMESMINAEVDKLVSMLKEKHEGKPTSLNMVMNLSIVNALWTILVGEELALDDPRLIKIVETLDENIREGGSLPNFILMTLGPYFVRRFDPLYVSLSDVVGKIKDLVWPHVKKHQETFDEVNQPRDFIDIYLKEIGLTKDKQSSFYGQKGEHSLVVSLVDLFVAGSETTTSTLLWGILFLMNHPDIQEKVHEEMDRVLGDNPHASLQDEPRLPYTCSVLSEIHRMASILPSALPHLTKEAVEVDGYVIPKDTMVFSNLMRIHYDERYWEDPSAFNPERFYDKEAGKCIKNINLVPFGIGKRFCLGQPLAEKELFLFFVGLMKNFRFENAPNQPPPAFDYSTGVNEAIIRSSDVYNVVLRSR